jgi:thiol-disulfide isomerase/thioredoxin
MTPKLRLSALVAALLLAAAARPLPAEAPEKGKPDIYDVKADAKALISTALARAKKENQRVLVMFGGNWCGWCHKLHDLFQKNPEIARLLLYEYRLVMVDSNTNQQIAAGYGADLAKHGVPYLTVLSADGKVLSNQDTGSLEDGPKHDPAKVKAFLSKWVAPQEDAGKVLKDGLARAAAEKKQVLLHFGAPWCPYCRKLDDFLDQQKELFERDSIDVKIDTDRMAKGKEVGRKFMGASTGIPWMAILDAEGKVLASGDGPQGNIGYPVEPHEIDHFIGMLKKTARKLGPGEIDEIRKDLEKRAKELKQPAPRPAAESTRKG